jgi:hypothetical protein
MGGRDNLGTLGPAGSGSAAVRPGQSRTAHEEGLKRRSTGGQAASSSRASWGKSR